VLFLAAVGFFLPDGVLDAGLFSGCEAVYLTGVNDRRASTPALTG
jgi:hypothetical protein